jgi:hypothetical protein
VSDREPSPAGLGAGSSEAGFGAGPSEAGFGAGPSEAVLAAIVAAVEVAWPRPVVVAPDAWPEPPGPWRFSGRWWSKPSAVRRERPWVARVS